MKPTEQKTVTFAQKRAFILANLRPYYQNPATTGYETNSCVYLSHDGKMCVAGKNMKDPSKWSGGIKSILHMNSQEDVFKPEAVGVLTNDEWISMQQIHDAIATKYSLDGRIPEWQRRELEGAMLHLGVTFEDLASND